MEYMYLKQVLLDLVKEFILCNRSMSVSK